MQRPCRMMQAVLAAGVIFLLLFDAGKSDCREPTMKILDEMRQIEFTRISYDEEASPYYGYIKGSIPLLISAPHGAKHFRAAEGVWKEEDAYTSSLAIVLGRLTGAHVLFVKNKTGEDPNNDAGTRYKEALEKAVEENGIKFVLDLHGSSARRPFKVDVGIMHASRSLVLLPELQGHHGKGICRLRAPDLQSVFSRRHREHYHLFREETSWDRGGPDRDQRRVQDRGEQIHRLQGGPAERP